MSETSERKCVAGCDRRATGEGLLPQFCGPHANVLIAETIARANADPEPVVYEATSQRGARHIVLPEDLRAPNTTEPVTELVPLLPCPFCGGSDLEPYAGDTAVICSDCHAHGPLGALPGSALWNRRAGQSPAESPSVRCSVGGCVLGYETETLSYPTSASSESWDLLCGGKAALICTGSERERADCMHHARLKDQAAPQLSAERALELAVHFDKGYMTGSALSYVLEAAPYLRAYAAQCETITERYNYERKLLTTIATQSSLIRQHEETIAKLATLNGDLRDEVREVLARCRKAENERDAALQIVAERETAIAGFKQAIAERDATIERLGSAWKSRVEDAEQSADRAWNGGVETIDHALLLDAQQCLAIADRKNGEMLRESEALKDASAALRRELDEARSLVSGIGITPHERAALKERDRACERLASAEERSGKLERYTGHARSCAAVTCDRLGNRVSTGEVCDCGLAALLAEEKLEGRS